MEEDRNVLASGVRDGDWDGQTLCGGQGRIPGKKDESSGMSDTAEYRTSLHRHPDALLPEINSYQLQQCHLPGACPSGAHDSVSSIKSHFRARVKNWLVRDDRVTAITFENIRPTVSTK
jgi:hypothetical protein